MARYLLERLGAAALVMWLAVSLAFVALRGLPGDAVDAALMRSGASAREIAARRAALGLDDPLGQQYVAYWRDFLRGDLGESLISQQPVSDLIAQNAGPTVALAAAGLWVGVTLGIGLGVVAGASPWRGMRWGAGLMIALALSTPVYWTATLAIYLFAVVLDALPGTGGYGPRYLILPAGVLGFHTAGAIAQVTAVSVRATAGQDFVQTARAKGLPRADVLDHILRVGLLPAVTVIALQLGFLLGGAVITETIFVRRGLGRVLIQAVNTRDYPVIQGLVALSALVYSAINGLADAVYVLLDPRMKWDG